MLLHGLAPNRKVYETGYSQPETEKPSSLSKVLLAGICFNKVKKSKQAC